MQLWHSRTGAPLNRSDLSQSCGHRRNSRGYRAAVHWGAREALGQFGAEPSDERVCVDRNRLTGAGITSGVDFGITVAGRWAGENMGRVIERVPSTWGAALVGDRAFAANLAIEGPAVGTTEPGQGVGSMSATSSATNARHAASGRTSKTPRMR